MANVKTKVTAEQTETMMSDIATVKRAIEVMAARLVCTYIYVLTSQLFKETYNRSAIIKQAQFLILLSLSS